MKACDSKGWIHCVDRHCTFVEKPKRYKHPSADHGVFRRRVPRWGNHGHVINLQMCGVYRHQLHR